jgi:hypothetical protein
MSVLRIEIASAETRLICAEIYSRMIAITKKSETLRNLFGRCPVSPACGHHGCSFKGDTTMKSLPAIFTVLRIATGIALGPGPASAQSFCTCDGTGNVLVFSNRAFMPANGKKTVLNDRALQAYASEGYGAAGPNSPATTGGGSAGYNAMLRNY